MTQNSRRSRRNSAHSADLQRVLREHKRKFAVLMKGTFLEVNLAGEKFFLLHHRAIYRPRRKQLILSDLHLGKASHFRKQGIAMPGHSHLNDLEKLAFLLRAWQPEQVLILGDLFHSDYNREWLWFEALVKEFCDMQFILVIGNHDILPEKAYRLENLLRASEIEEPKLIFSHAPLDQPKKLNICGHIHPGYEISGAARQSFRLPCFYKEERLFIVPAFGELTGLYLMERKESADYYLVTRDTIVKV